MTKIHKYCCVPLNDQSFRNFETRKTMYEHRHYFATNDECNTLGEHLLPEEFLIVKFIVKCKKFRKKK